MSLLFPVDLGDDVDGALLLQKAYAVMPEDIFFDTGVEERTEAFHQYRFCVIVGAQEEFPPRAYLEAISHHTFILVRRKHHGWMRNFSFHTPDAVHGCHKDSAIFGI